MAAKDGLHHIAGYQKSLSAVQYLHVHVHLHVAIINSGSLSWLGQRGSHYVRGLLLTAQVSRVVTITIAARLPGVARHHPWHVGK